MNGKENLENVISALEYRLSEMNQAFEYAKINKNVSENSGTRIEKLREIIDLLK